MEVLPPDMREDGAGFVDMELSPVSLENLHFVDYNLLFFRRKSFQISLAQS